MRKARVRSWIRLVPIGPLYWRRNILKTGKIFYFLVTPILINCYSIVNVSNFDSDNILIMSDWEDDDIELA